MDKLRIHQNKIIIPACIVAVILFSLASYNLGFTSGLSQTKNIEITGLKNAENPDVVQEDFSTFWEAWATLKAKHINGATTSERTLLEGAIQGIAGSFDDSYTTYFNVQESKKFNEDVRGTFGGIGAEIGIKSEQLIVVAPLKDTPAERAGLKPKDNILEVDGKSTGGMRVEEAVKLIRGEPGTKVILTIFRDGWDKSREIPIIREVIQVPTLKSEIGEDGIWRVDLYSFNRNSETLFAKAVSDALAKGAKGMILDLRNNPGGYLDVAVRLAGWFLERGDVVVRERFASGKEDELKTYGNERLKDFPVVVIINEGSASASEILAGALRDNRDIKLVGAKSFGKGTVQELVSLEDGSMLKITIANWLLPKGLLIDKNGIEPDYKVEVKDEDLENDIDAQFNKAKEVLRSQIR